MPDKKPTFKLDLPPAKQSTQLSKSGNKTKRPLKVTLDLPKKSTQGSTLDGPQNIAFHKDQMIHLPTDEQVQEMKETRERIATRELGPTTKQIQVVLDYNSSILGQPFMLIMECIEDRICNAKPQDKDADYWFQHFNNLGALPFRVLARDIDRFFMALYAAAYIHHNNLMNSKELQERNPGPSLHNPDWDPNAENVEQDGRHWGMKMDTANLPKTSLTPDELAASRKALLEGSKLSNRPKVEPINDEIETHDVPVREQVEIKKVTDLKEYVMAQNDMKQLEKIRATADNTYVQKWAIAERLARKPKADWENAPFELKQMVEFCYGWIRDTGEVPYYPDSVIEIWWKRPTASVINMTPEAIVRRDAIVERVRQFWVKSVAASPPQKINLHSESYRVTLAAMEMEKLIEEYANGTDNAVAVRTAAMKYFHAHFPIEALGVKPGPIGTVDPDFGDYIKLCQKYNIKVGTLLHEAEL